MLAAVYHGVRDMRLEEVPTPRPGPGEALVRVVACGICQTDYCAYTGARTNWTPPMIAGHEISGVVEEAGDGVPFRPGDEVVVSPVVSCGRCYYCRTDRANHCRHGKVIGGEGQPTFLPGAFAEYVLAPEGALFAKPAGVPHRSACLTEPLAGCYKGLIDFSALRIGEDLVIIGTGSMGMLLLLLGKAAGAGRIVAVDTSDWRLQMARRLGATHAFNPARDDVARAVPEALGKPPDVVFEAAGTLPAAQLAFALADRLTRVNMFGVIVPGEVPVSPSRIHFTETSMQSSFSVTPRVMTRSLELQERGLVDPGRIVTHAFPLAEIHKAFEVMESPERVKVVIEP